MRSDEIEDALPLADDAARVGPRAPWRARRARSPGGTPSRADAVAVHDDADRRRPGGDLHLRVRRARDLHATALRIWSATSLIGREVLAVHLDGDVALHAGDEIVDAHLDGLAERVERRRDARLELVARAPARASRASSPGATCPAA